MSHIDIYFDKQLSIDDGEANNFTYSGEKPFWENYISVLIYTYTPPNEDYILLLYT